MLSKTVHCAIWLLAVVAVMAEAAELGQGTYTVLAPYALRPNAEYQVAATVQNAREDTTVHVDVTGPGNDGVNQTYKGQVVVPPNTSKTAVIQVGDLVPGKVRLSARGEGGAPFVNSTDVEVRGKNASLFIQMDKAQYKPGQSVNIRVIVLDPELKPTVSEPLAVHITDGKNNRVKQWLGARPVNGIWSATLPLSEQPVLGDWTVTASLKGVKDTKVDKSFSVAEYVLPTFEVSVSAPEVVAFNKGRVVVSVSAKYTYGKPVTGKATVKASLPYYLFSHDYGVHDTLLILPNASPVVANTTSDSTTTTTSSTTTTTPVPPSERFVQKTVDIDGTAMVEFDMKDELRLSDDHYWNSVSFEAWVVEELTSRRQNASGSAYTNVRRHDFNLAFVDSPHEFTPGETVTLKVKVSDLDGAPIQDDKNLVRLNATYHWNEKVAVIGVKPVPASGIVAFEVPTKENISHFSVMAEYRTQTAHHYMHQPRKITYRPADPKIQITIDPEEPKLGDEVELRVTSTEPLGSVSLLVTGPLGIQEVHRLALQAVPGDANKTEAALRVRTTPAMAPVARIVVHGIKPDDELVTEATAFKINTTLPLVGVRVQPGRTEPGRAVEVHLSANPNATVALLAVDQSVLLLKEPTNDITSDQVKQEMLTYESTVPTPWGWRGSGSESLVGSWHWRSWNSDAQEAFSNAGLAFLTNAKIVQPVQDITLYGDNMPVGAVSTTDKLGAGAPIAMIPAAMPAFAAGVANKEPPRVRKLFPETWLWEQIDAGADGNVTLKRTVPDTITSWFVSALAIDPKHGLGLSAPSKLTVFRPFFLSLSLPYSVIRGESVEVPVLVFNYMDEDVTATITFDNEHGEFEFTSGQGRSRRASDARSQTRQVKVPAQSSAGVAFDITPKKVGNILLKATATSDKAGDAVERPLKVKAEGETQYTNKAIPIDLRKDKTFKTTVPLEVPDYMVPDSENIEVSAVGDVLGPSSANLDSLIRMPNGCGEQNMLNFVPNIVITKYMRHIRQATPALEQTARTFTEVGYQKEMTYRHKDGSFSAFGESDKNGTTWLTAFVAKSFRMARSLVDVEERVIDEALLWLAKQQTDNGSFPEVGTVSHRDMQGGSAKGLALTAYVLTTFLQQQDSDSTFKHQDSVKRALEYLVANLDSVQDDPYAVAIVTHTLHVAGHPDKDKAFKMLEAMAQNTAGHRWWKKEVPSDPDNPFWFRPSPVNVEMTSYALLTYLQRGLVEEALPIMQWLISQRNSNGGFASTQDTVVGLTALAAMAERISFPGGDMRVVFKYAGKPGNVAKVEVPVVINSKTGVVLQKHELPRHVREVEVSAEGAGFALAQVSWSFNEDTVGKHPLFNLRVDVDNTTSANLLAFRVCSSFVAGRWGMESNMAVAEVSLPSGFVADSDSLKSLKANANVRRVETKDQDTVIILYFDKMETKEYCVDVSAIRTHLVANQKPVPVTVYDYYDQTRQARVFYEAPPVDLGDKQ